jgi:hypothetical protein
LSKNKKEVNKMETQQMIMFLVIGVLIGAVGIYGAAITGAIPMKVMPEQAQAYGVVAQSDDCLVARGTVDEWFSSNAGVTGAYTLTFTYDGYVSELAAGDIIAFDSLGNFDATTTGTANQQVWSAGNLQGVFWRNDPTTTAISFAGAPGAFEANGFYWTLGANSDTINQHETIWQTGVGTATTWFNTINTVDNMVWFGSPGMDGTHKIGNTITQVVSFNPTTGTFDLGGTDTCLTSVFKIGPTYIGDPTDGFSFNSGASTQIVNAIGSPTLFATDLVIDTNGIASIWAFDRASIAPNAATAATIYGTTATAVGCHTGAGVLGDDGGICES